MQAKKVVPGGWESARWRLRKERLRKPCLVLCRVLRVWSSVWIRKCNTQERNEGLGFGLLL